MQSSTRSEEVKQLLLAGPETPWKKYCELAARTESVPSCYFEKVNESAGAISHKSATRLLHAALGICTEVAEYLNNDGSDRNVAEELGDVAWYLAIIENEFSIPALGDLGFGVNFKFEIHFWLGEIQDIIKRHVFYGTAIDLNRLYTSYHGVQHWLDQQAYYCGIDFPQLLAANIVKLEKRYPDLCFNEEHAVKRDVENELSHIPGAPTFLYDPTKVTIEDIDKQSGYFIKSAKPESLLVGRAEFHLGNEAEKLENADTIFDVGSAVIHTGESFNIYLRSNLSFPEIEKLAMSVCFSTAEYYRGINAMGVARGYDALYREYSGKGDKLEDLSVFIMWRDLGYGLREDQIVMKLIELGCWSNKVE